jgi:DNA polymerase-3 subunit alpha
VKNVGRPAAEEIVRVRKESGPYTDMEDFLERVRSKDLNKKSLEALAKVGALDGLSERNRVIGNLDTIISYAKSLQKIKETHEDSLFGSLALERPKIRYGKTVPATKKERLSWEKELIGLYVSDHPVSDYESYLEAVAKPLHDIGTLPDGASVRVGGVVGAAKKILTKNGSNMYFVTLEDLSGRAEVIVFPKAVEGTESLWQGDDIVLIEGKISRKDGESKILLESAKKIDQDEVERFRSAERMRQKSENEKRLAKKVDVSEMTVFLRNDSGPETLESLSKTLRKTRGGTVRVMLSVAGKIIRTPFSVTVDDRLVETLRDTTGSDPVFRDLSHTDG